MIFCHLFNLALPALFFNTSLGWLLAGAHLTVYLNNDGTDTLCFQLLSSPGACHNHSLLVFSRSPPLLLWSWWNFCPSWFYLHFENFGHFHCGGFTMTDIEDMGRFYCFAYFCPWEFHYSHVLCISMPFHCISLPSPSLMYIHCNLDQIYVFGSI